MAAVPTFNCAICNGVFEKSLTDYEANEEAQQLWGVENASSNPDFAVICDNCFNRRTPAEREAMGQEYKRDRRAN